MTTLTLTRRNVYLDRWRGLAILTMILDHVLVLTDDTSFLRWATRISAPIFFLVSGHLVKRINWQRLGIVFVVGYLLGEYLSWIDGPNVLCIYAVGVPLLVWAQRWQYGLPLLIALPLTIFANGFWHVSGYYNPVALVGLMALGRLVKAVPNIRLPLEQFGRYPLSIYIGHLLILAILFQRF